MKKVFGLAILAAFIATPALAGETFVRNEWSKTHSNTITNLTIDSDTYSNRNEDYSSYADKIYADGDVSLDKSYEGLGVEFDEFSVHTASSSLTGNFHENSSTYVDGTIFTNSTTNSNYHETTAGVR